MSHPRLHTTLAALFERKDKALLEGCLAHPAFRDFAQRHGLRVPGTELVTVFTHTSFSHEFGLPHQERLEFLGDAVLQLILTEKLFSLYPEEKEGRLSKLRSALVNERFLAQLAQGLCLGELLLVGRGEFNKRLFEQEAVLADTFEALLAQVYRFQGLEFVRELLLGWITAYAPKALSLESLQDFDAKSGLQELSLAKYKKLPRYSAEPVGEKFEVTLWLNDEVAGRGVFASKKAGEKELAQAALRKEKF